MTEWELQQVTDTLVMANEKRLMPTISNMLIALSDERAALLEACKLVRSAVEAHMDGHGEKPLAFDAGKVYAAIAKAES
jgi:hypothetical protein